MTLGYQLLGNAFIAHKEGDTGGQIQAGFVETYKSPAPIRYVLTSAVTSIPFIPTPKQPANPTSQLQMQWILDSVRVKNQSRSCLQYSSGTLQVDDVTLSVSAALKRSMDINLTWVGRGNNVNFSVFVHNAPQHWYT